LHLIVEYRDTKHPQNCQQGLHSSRSSSPGGGGGPAAQQTANFVDTTPPGGTSIGLSITDVTNWQQLDPLARATAMEASAGPSAEQFIAAAAASGIALAEDSSAGLVILNNSSFPTSPGSNDTMAGAATAGTTGAKRRLMQSAVTTVTTIHDILIVYTSAAAANKGGVTNILSQIRMTVAMANKAYVDSQLPVVLNVVAILQVSSVINLLMASFHRHALIAPSNNYACTDNYIHIYRSSETGIINAMSLQYISWLVMNTARQNSLFPNRMCTCLQYIPCMMQLTTGTLQRAACL
jgi:hypothetical protein